MNRSAIFSCDRKYRYTLWRDWPDDLFSNRTKPGFVQFIGLNPSTADEKQDDPTLRRCMDFARRWGYLEMCMTNLFAYRATDPDEIKDQQFPCGEALSNDGWLKTVSDEAALIICCWGKHGSFTGRSEVVSTMIRQRNKVLWAIRLCKDGLTPEHPLYLPAKLEPIPLFSTL